MRELHSSWIALAERISDFGPIKRGSEQRIATGLYALMESNAEFLAAAESGRGAKEHFIREVREALEVNRLIAETKRPC